MNEGLAENPPKPSQIFTLARAVRPNKKHCGVLREKHLNMLLNENISKQIKEAINITNGNIERRQPRSHLPLNMIVSKMATRKPVLNNEDQCSQDLSIYSKHFKLAPPPWQNKLNRNKHRQPSASQKIIQTMKEKSAEFDSSQNQESTIFAHNSRSTDIGRLVSNVRLEENSGLTTPRLNFNYNQLYKSRENSVEIKNSTFFEGEDPLELDTSELHQEEQHVTEIDDDLNPRSISLQDEQDSEFAVQLEQEPELPVQLEEEPEFVWNPVLVTNRSIRDSSPIYEPMNEPFTTDSEYEFVIDLPTNLTDPSYTMAHNLPAFDSSSGNWESSSTSSDHTIAEETLQLTYVTVQGGASSNKCKCPTKKPKMSWPIHESTKNSTGLSWLDLRRPFFKFLEE